MVFLNSALSLLLCVLFCPMQLIKGDSTGVLLRYMEFNDVPTYVYLGLLSGLPADQIQKVEFIEGLCFDYDILDFDRCKFYSDCCAMTSPRPMEQLAKGTFSCHDGFYIVDHCPAGTNSTLKDLCERFTPNDSDLSLERWPVRGTLNELSYKNIYCAMCNGILPQSSFYLQNVWWNIGEGFRQHINDTVNKVEWWPAQVHCDAESATDYIENFPTHSKLMELIESSCQVLYQPPNSPDLCFDAIRECPSSADSEITTLCEQGIANYIQVLSTNHIYRNQFCALCHGESVDDIVHPSVLANTETSLLLFWKGKKLRRFDGEKISLNDAIVITRPILFNMPNATFSFTDFNSLGADFTCSFFADSYFNFCQERILLLANNLTRSQTQFIPVWNLGSMSCYSMHKKICDQFIVQRVDSSEDTCTEPGCGLDHILDPRTRKCIKLNSLSSHNAFEENDLQWHSHSTCAYHSQCRAAELGLIAEEHLNCFCDKFCIYYNDCCEDSPYQATVNSTLDHGVFACIQDRSDLAKGATLDGYEWGVMEVRGCPKDYTNLTIENLCKSNLHTPPFFFPAWYRHDTASVPVTDMHTGLRYANLYCAMCHNVTNFRFWRVDVGCIQVANDECRFPLDINLDKEFYNLIDMLRNDPSVEQLNIPSCYVKQYLPPDGFAEVRRCQIDSSEYISTCPESTQNWKISQLCSDSPTSFVYEGSSLKKSIERVLHIFIQVISPNYDVDFKVYKQERKFRNSYCASCHGAAWLGCNPKPSLQLVHKQEDIGTVVNYTFSVSKFLVVYQIDLNNRTCNLDSDSILLYRNFLSGHDTCETISAQLSQCDCKSVLDIQTGECLPIKFAGNFCDHHKLSPESNEMSSYAKEICPSNFYYTVSNNSESTCSECQVEDLANCQPVYERFKDVAFTASSIHCAPNALLSCKSDLPSSSCLTSSGFSARSSSTGSIQFEKQAVFLNSIAISYNTTSFEFIIPIDLIGDTTFSSIEAIFSPLHAASNKCAEYTNVDKQALSPLLICKNHQLYSPADNFTHDDYLLVGENIQVCTALVPDFSLSIHDYIITAFSIAAATIYTVYYFVNLKKTVTGNFVVSSLLTVVGGLIFLCLIDQTGNKNSCRFIATFSHYFFLSSHTWTTSIGFWILKGIISFSIAQDRGWKTYLRYASFAWATPVVFVIFSYIFDGLEIRGLYPVFGDSLCFIATGWIRLLVFTGPIYLLILINVSFCAIATFKIIKEGNKITIQRKNELQRKVITVVKLQIVFGVHWILIIFSEIQGPHQQALWTIVKIFMTSQGVNVVIAQLVTLKNLRKVRFKFNSLVNPTNSTNLSSSSPQKEQFNLVGKSCDNQ